jgi:hypothetical protein
MNPKDKATQLFNKYYVSILEVNNDLSEEIIISILAKKRALIAVDDIISIVECYDRRHISNELNFWIEVKNEIEKL